MGAAIELTLKWSDRAQCVGTDPEAFFPEKGGSVAYAKRVCNGNGTPGSECPIKAECLERALENDERFGVFGGLSEPERRAIRRTLPKQPRRAQAIPPHGTEARAVWDRRRKLQPCQRCLDAQLLARQERKLKAPSVPKECKACHVVKPASDFAIEQSRADGLSRNCRQCKAEQYQVWYQANGRKSRKSVA